MNDWLERVFVPLAASALGGGVVAAILGEIRARRDRKDRAGREPLEQDLLKEQADNLAVLTMERSLLAANTRVTELETALSRAEVRAQKLDRDLRRRESEVEDLRVEVGRLRRLQGLSEQ